MNLAGAPSIGSLARSPDLPSALAGADYGMRTRSVCALQREVGNRQLARMLAKPYRQLARQPPGSKDDTVVADPEQGPSVPGPWGNELTLCNQVAAAVMYAEATLEDDTKGMDLDGATKTQADELIDEAKSWIEHLKPQGSAQINATDARSIRAFLLEVGALRKTLAWQKGEPARAEMRRAQQQAEQLERRVTEMQPHIDETMRMAFKAEDDDVLGQLSDVTGTALDIGMGIRELSRQMSESITHLTGTELPEVSRFTEGLAKANKGLAAISLALTLTQDKAATELEEGARQIGAAAGIFAALVTLAELPAHIALYADLYLVPLTKVCVAMIGRLAEYAHEENKSWVELEGEPLNFAVEPGGKPMWDYMVSVMKAGKDMPSMPKEVMDYFVEHRKQLAAGAHESLPVEGWIWKDLDPAQASAWMTRHRKQVWAMLYGSMRVSR
jgi:hypothetical protein